MSSPVTIILMNINVQTTTTTTTTASKFGEDNHFSLKHFLEELTQNSSRFQIN